MQFDKKEFQKQSKQILQCLHQLNKTEWKWDTRGFLIHECEIGENITNTINNQNQHEEEIIQEEEDETIIKINQNEQKRYKILHHIIYNTSYRVPQYGIEIFDRKQNKYLFQLEETTTILSQLSHMKKHDNSNPLDLFITLNEHPLIDDYFMFFIHPCNTATTITSIVESSIEDYLLCYLSSYGPSVCCNENWLKLSSLLKQSNFQQ